MSHMTYLTSRSLCKAVATLALASSSRLPAPKPRTSRPLTTTALSGTPGEKPQSQSTTRYKKRPPPPPPPAHESAATRSTHSRRDTAAADHSSSSSAHLRQQPQYSGSSQTSPSSSSSSGERKRALLQPYELSRRLNELCEQGNVDLAVTVLQRAPRNAQNIKVWNTIIQQCMSAKKYKLAYSVFTDMKRRGFMPNVRTYATMMSGYATVDDWSPLTTQLGLVHSVYGQLKQHLERSRKSIDDDPAGDSSEASFILYPIALYISILGKTGAYQKAFDVFHELDPGGPLAPSPKIYSNLLSALAERVDVADVEAEVIAQSVSQAKYIWRRHMRSLDKEPKHDVEPRSIDAMVKLLSRGDPSHHKLMFDILRDMCGLPSPSDGRSSSSTPSSSPKTKVEVTTWILNEILDGCIAADRPELAVHYAQSVMDNKKLRPILRAWHLHKLLSAHLLLAKKGSAMSSRAENVAAWVEWMVAQQDPTRESKETTPKERSIVSALDLCYRCKDAHSALRIARAMQGSSRPTGTHGATSSGSLSLPVKAWEYLFRLATMAGQDEKRRCLELLNSYGSSILDVWVSTLAAIERLAPMEKRAHISLALQVLKTVQPSSDYEGPPDAVDLEAWSDIRKRAESFLEKTRSRKS